MIVHDVDVAKGSSFTLRAKAVRVFQLAARDIGKSYGMNKKASETLKGCLQELALKTFPSANPIQEEGAVNFDGSMTTHEYKIGSHSYELGILKFKYDGNGDNAIVELYVAEQKKGKKIPSMFTLMATKKGSVDNCTVQMRTLLKDIIASERQSA